MIDHHHIRQLREAAESRRRHLEHCRDRKAEIDAQPDIQPWAAEHARRTVAEAAGAVERYELALAMAEAAAT